MNYTLTHSTHKKKFVHFHDEGTSKTFECQFDLNSILIVTRGDIVVSCGEWTEQRVCEGYMFLVQAQVPFKFDILSLNGEPGSVIALQFDELPMFCDKQMHEFEKQQQLTYTKGFCTLHIDGLLKSFCHLLEGYFEHLHDIFLGELKIREFFFLLCAHNNKAKVAEFLHPLREHNNSVFRLVAVKEAKLNLTVRQWAHACGYSETLFRSHFVNEFGTTPGEWQKRQRMMLVVNLLSDPTLPLVDVAERCELSSVQELSRFCRKNLHDTPAQLRKNLTDNSNANILDNFTPGDFS